jgi:hypothetical protein
MVISGCLIAAMGCDDRSLSRLVAPDIDLAQIHGPVS